MTTPHAYPDLQLLARIHGSGKEPAATITLHRFVAATKDGEIGKAISLAKELNLVTDLPVLIRFDDDSQQYMVGAGMELCITHHTAIHDAMEILATLHGCQLIECGPLEPEHQAIH